MRLPLDNQTIVRPLMQKVQDILEGERDRINASLSIYQQPGGGAMSLGGIYLGRRPSRSLQTFPNITISSTTRSPEWDHQRMTKETITLRIYCNVMVMDDDYHEFIMLDLTDVVESILMQNTIFFWEGRTGDPPQPITYTTNTSSVLGISHGTVDSGYLKSGQIDWGCEMYMNWENLNFRTEGLPTTSATKLIFIQQPEASATVNTPLPVAPIIAAENDLSTVDGDYLANTTLTLKAGTGTPGAALAGNLTLASIGGVYIAGSLSINKPGNGYVIQAQSGGLTVGESTPINVLAPASDLRVITVPSTVAANTPFDVVVEVRDSTNQVVPTYTGLGVLTLSGGSGFLKGGYWGNFGSGFATFSGLSISDPGTYTLSPVSGSLTAHPVTLTVT